MIFLYQLGVVVIELFMESFVVFWFMRFDFCIGFSIRLLFFVIYCKIS